jgi:hypothetical protein
MLIPIRQLLFGSGHPPVFTGPIADISVTNVQPSFTFALASYFSGATSYSISPSLPSGWSFNTSTATLIVGTGSLAAFGPFAITAFNGTGSTASNLFAITVTAFAQPPLFAGAIPSQSYARNVTIPTFAAGSYFQGATSYAIVGTLPAGLSIDSTTGVISGTPVEAIVQPLVVRATNSDGSTDSNLFTISVIAASAANAGKPILDIIKEACRRLGLTVPNAAVSNTDIQIQQLVAILNEEGQELSARYAWQALTREAQFTTVGTQSQGELDGGILSSSENMSYVVNDTIWNRTTRLPVYGPNSPGDWAYKQSMTFSTPVSQYRILGNQLVFYPAPSVGDTCAFEYVTRNWLRDSTQTTYRDYCNADSDTPLIDWQLLLLGLIWRWKAAKGFDYDQAFQNYQMRVSDAISRDGTKPTLSLTGLSDADAGIQPLVIASSGNWLQ